jgi:hypothetical protein
MRIAIGLSVLLLSTLLSTFALGRSTSSSVCTGLSPAECNSALDFLQPSQALPRTSSLPARPLLLKDKTVALYSGIQTDLSSDGAGKSWLLPLGGSVGVRPWLEVGVESNWLLQPYEASTTIADVNVYGRFRIIEDRLAGQLTIWIPTVLHPQVGVDLLLPAHLRAKIVDFLPLFHFNYYAGTASDDMEVGVSLSTFFTVVRGFFLGVDLGFSYARGNMDTSTDATDNLVALVGAGLGYRFGSDTFLKLMFTFPDLASEDTKGDFNGVERRALTLTVVQALGGI